MTNKPIKLNKESETLSSVSAVEGIPLSSQYLAILQNIQASIQGLGLQFNSSTVEILIKKISRWTADISLPNLPLIFVVGVDRPESVVPWSTEDEVLVKYLAYIVTVAAGNQDNIANLDVWLSWREQERRLLQWGLGAKISSAFMSEFLGDPPILKEAFLRNYDVSGFGFKIWNIEPRTN